MALRDQPYLPLYVQDYLTDEKLNRCSAATQGIYIKIMCVFHKSDPYGGILLKQKDKQKESTCLNFASVLAKLLPFDASDILSAINELLDEKVLIIEGDFLFQKRMLKDNHVSNQRSISGKKGGKKTQNKINKFALAKSEANSEYENENDNEDINKNKESEKINPLPSHLQTEAVMKKWDAWMKHRRGMKKPKSWVALFNAQIEWLNQYTPDQVISILDKSIIGGYQGLFEPTKQLSKPEIKPCMEKTEHTLPDKP